MTFVPGEYEFRSLTNREIVETFRYDVKKGSCTSFDIKDRATQVIIHDLTGTHRDEYFDTTDTRLSPKQVIEYFTGRWSIEVTFQEARAHLGVEITRGWSEQTVLRAEPCLFGLYIVVALWYAVLPDSDRQELAVEWNGKARVTYSDAITIVRRDLWRHWIFANPAYRSVLQKLSPTQKRQLIHTISLAL